jgi:hypothetical protein
VSVSTILTSGLGGFGNIPTLITDGLAEYLLLAQPPAAGQQYTTQTTLYAGGGFSLQQGAVPAVAIGDIFITPTTVSPGAYQLQVNPDGTIVVYSGGDTSRQSFQYYRYDLSLNVIDGPGTVWLNEVAPIWNSAISLPTSQAGQIFPGVPITPVYLPNYAYSTSGDVLTWALYSGALPQGLSIVGNQIVGTPTALAVGTSTFQLTAMDITGTSTPSPPCQITITSNVILPNVGDGYTRSYPRLRGRSNRQPPLNMDWQSVSSEEAEKVRRLDRKRAEEWRGPPEEPPEVPPDYQLRPIGGEPPFEDWDLLRALHPAATQDDHEVRQMLNREVQDFLKMAIDAHRRLQ